MRRGRSLGGPAVIAARTAARSSERPDLDTPFVFVGPQGFPFPADAESRLHAAFTRLWTELYGDPTN